MSFLEVAQRVIGEGTIQVAFLIDEAGTVHWSHGEWPALVPSEVLKSWQNKATAITVGDLRFSVIDMDVDRYIGRNIKGSGTLILAKCLNWAGYLIAWAPDGVESRTAYAEAAKMANAVRS